MSAITAPCCSSPLSIIGEACQLIDQSALVELFVQALLYEGAMHEFPCQGFLLGFPSEQNRCQYLLWAMHVTSLMQHPLVDFAVGTDMLDRYLQAAVVPWSWAE